MAQTDRTTTMLQADQINRRSPTILILAFALLMLLAIVIGVIFVNGFPALEARTLPEINTQLLVRAPDQPLPLNKSITVRSITEANNGVSHVELYAVDLPTGQKNVLIHSDPAPTVNQPSFTVAQTFTPLQPGHYVIKVVGYNSLGQSDESDYIGFDVQ